MGSAQPTDKFDLPSYLEEMGETVGDVARITGRTRVTVWRWKVRGRVPAYVATILRQRQEIMRLRAADAR